MANNAQIIAAFKRVEETLRVLCLHIYDELGDYPVWIDSGTREWLTDRDKAIDKVIYVLKHLKFSDTLRPQQTFACVGAVGATLKTFELITQVNQAKDALRECVNDYLIAVGHRDTLLVRQLLSDAGYPRIALKQVYRHIKTLAFHPRHIGFTQTEDSSNRSITRLQAEKLLLKTGQGIHIDIQLAKISLLNKDEKLVIRRQIHRCWTANYATFKNEKKKSTFDKVLTSIPLFYLHDHNAALPIVVFSQSNKKRRLGSRADKKTESTPFISSLSAYRYK